MVDQSENDPLKMITVRLPRSQRDQLNLLAAKVSLERNKRVSLNQMCVEQLMGFAAVWDAEHGGNSDEEKSTEETLLLDGALARHNSAVAKRYL